MTSHAPSRARQIARIRRLRGQLEALERALSEDRDTGEVLRQMAAVRGASDGLVANFIADCIQRCTRQQLSSNSRAARKDMARIDEAIRTYLR
ncbi:DNA-binding transcriptional regulator, FrmR family [Solimonas aquatica]|uniref:DNA-binding transcriptional regulator, FrmR family n=1 Tax=Solimonas aquatica TaxID=489703 RepID=A0A1H9KF18_9GAMM|nr:metal-sensing transcriptional repressor [Solimonas aquatica]SEQ97535.1 DNA-binding transcriptional regulator, FrmR family [Solimonas aquatica]